MMLAGLPYVEQVDSYTVAAAQQNGAGLERLANCKSLNCFVFLPSNGGRSSLHGVQ
jgi:hypothetical protein